MNKVKLITDSCCSFSPEELKELDIDYIAMDITINGTSFNSFDVPEKDPEKFYDMLEKAEHCSTSCINTFAFTEMFEKYVNAGYDVMYIGLSGGMSCTNNNAKLVASDVNERFGERVFVADSLTGSYGVALMLLGAKRLMEEGKSAKQICEALDKNGLRVYSIFIPGDLKFLRRSGRINRFAASIGSMLKIAPVITANEKGELKLFSKCLGRKKALETIKKYILENADLTSADKIYIGHTGQKQEAEDLAAFVKNNSKNKDITIGYIDYTMGCNCGPKTLAIFGYLK